jgi:hypothetical protein
VPFLRFARDKRGYEHTYLLHVNPQRGGSARLLYWYRTPPGVKVGRAAFDESARQALEAQYPGIGFDWHMLMSTPTPAPDVERWRERRRAEKAARQASQAERNRHESSESAEVADLEAGTDSQEPDEPEAPLQDPTAVANASSQLAAGEASESSMGAPAADELDFATSVGDPTGTKPPAMADAAGRTRRRRRRGGRRRRREFPSAAPAGLPPAPASGGAAEAVEAANLAPSEHWSSSSDPAVNDDPNSADENRE